MGSRCCFASSSSCLSRIHCADGPAVNDGDKLAARMLKAGRQLYAMKKIDQKQLGEVITKFQQLDQLVSAIRSIAMCIHLTLRLRLNTLLLCGTVWQNLSSRAYRPNRLLQCSG